jgi:predicted O-methyltransferase YrrM
MKYEGWKGQIRETLHALFAFIFTGEYKLILRLARSSRLGDLSSYVENIALYRCAKEGWGEGSIVEIGSFKGRTTTSLALASSQSKKQKVYAIDPLEDPGVRAQFLENIKTSGIADYIIPIFKKSAAAGADCQVPVRLLFIDGCHEYGAVKEDILQWKEKLIDGGIIAMHDYIAQNPPEFISGVRKAVEECILNSPEFIAEGQIDTLFFASKRISQNKGLFTKIRSLEKWRQRFKALIDKGVLKY